MVGADDMAASPVRGRSAYPRPGGPDDGGGLPACFVGGDVAGGAGDGLGTGGQAKGPPVHTREAAADEAEREARSAHRAGAAQEAHRDERNRVRGRGAGYHTTGGEPTRLEFGLAAEDAAEFGAQLAQLGEKLRSTEHWTGKRGGMRCERGGECGPVLALAARLLAPAQVWVTFQSTLPTAWTSSAGRP